MAGYTVNSYANLASNFGSVVNAFSAAMTERTIMKHNAAMAGYERYWADKKTEQQLEILYDDEARILGSNRAQSGASGFSIASETNRDIERDILQNVAKEASVIRAEGGLANMRISAKQSAYEQKADAAVAKGISNVSTALTKTTSSKGFTNLFKRKGTV